MLLAGAGAGAGLAAGAAAGLAAGADAGFAGAGAGFAAGAVPSLLIFADMATADILGSTPPVISLATWLTPLTPLIVSLSEDLKSIVLSGIMP